MGWSNSVLIIPCNERMTDQWPCTSWCFEVLHLSMRLDATPWTTTYYSALLSSPLQSMTSRPKKK
eukprot:6486854-Amphidinium_carterae.2